MEPVRLSSHYYFITLAEGSCNKNISLDSAGSAGSAVPPSAVPQISVPHKEDSVGDSVAGSNSCKVFLPNSDDLSHIHANLRNIF